MATTSYNKAPPLLSSSKTYSDWKKLINIWTELTTLEKKKQGPALVLTLEGKAQEAALELPQAQITGDNGVKQILTRLDKIYEKDKLTEKFNAIEKFEGYKRVKENTIREFLVEFDKRLHKIKNYIEYPEDLLAYRLLKAANLEPTHEKLIKATITELNYEDVRNKLVKVFADESISNLEGDFAGVKIKSEPTFFGRESEEENTSEEEENTFYTRNRQPYRNKPKGGTIRKSNYRTEQTNKSDNRARAPEKGKNPLDRFGRVTRCSICDSINHWQQDCPDRNSASNETYVVHEIVLHNVDDSAVNLRNLVSETWNCGLLDCGASKTVCGEVWLKQYLSSLPEKEKNDVKYYSSKSVYRFGVGDQVQASQGVSIPAYIGITKVQIKTDVILKDLPLLLSRSFMKRANMVLDFQKDIVSTMNQTIKLNTTSSGHYTIPLTKPRQLLMNLEDQNTKITFVSTTNQSDRQIATKLHRQFAHPSLQQLLSLLNKAGNPWSNNHKLKEELKKVTEECTTCQVYQKAPPKPVVGLPMATKFQETVAMDLKFYENKIILHLIDMCTRLSSATTIKNKNPSTVIEAILKIWVSVYGTNEKFLVDNGGEFANAEFINLAEQFGITIKTTAAESPWSNGIVERHNLTIANMLDKVLRDTDCSFDMALSWCINAKNSLTNVHGFSPYQLAIGTNPRLPSITTDKPPALSGEPATTLIKTNLDALHKAREAFIQSEHSERIRRALSHNIRTSGDVKYITGDQVYYKRKDSNEWHGPGTVLGQDGQQILIKHSSYYVRVHPCRVKLVNCQQSDNQLANNSCSKPQEKTLPDSDTTTTTNHNKRQEDNVLSSDESDVDFEKQIQPDEGAIEEQLNSADSQTRKTPQRKLPQIPVKIKPKVNIRFQDKGNNWVNARVLSRAGKVGGKHDGWFNIETEDGTKRSVNLKDIKDIEINDNDDETSTSMNLFNSNDDGVLQAKERELNSWKSQEVYKEVDNTGQTVMSLRWVITPKVINGQPSVKARLVARGFEELQDFRTDSPTCSKEGLRIALLLLVSQSWSLHSLDVKTAFLQGESINRDLYVKPPKEAGTNKLWKLQKTVYGLADASRSWYLKLRSELIKLKGKPVSLDQGIFLWFDGSTLFGLMACFVDDVLWAGTNQFVIIINKLKETFSIGAEYNTDFKYIGIHLQQNDDGTISIDQKDYVKDLEVITLEQDRKGLSKQEPVNEIERSQIRQVIGKLNWVAGMTRPEISFTVSEISSRIGSATLDDIKRINKTVKFLQSTPGFITIPKLDLNSIKLKVFTDASFNNLNDGNSQGGHIVFCTDATGNCTPISWSSNKVKRVVRSTLAAETLSFSDGAESGIHLSNMLKEFAPQLRTLEIECITDSRSLFESAGTTTSVSDKRLRVEINCIREMIKNNEIVIKWIKGEGQLSNVLTKAGASPFSLMDVIQSGKFLDV